MEASIYNKTTNTEVTWICQTRKSHLYILPCQYKKTEELNMCVVYMCMLLVHVLTCVHACGGQNLKSHISLYHAPP